MGEGTLRWPRLLHPSPSAAAAPQHVSPELLGPPPVMHLEVHWAMPPEVVAHVEVPANQWADGWCSCVRYGECGPSIIWKEKSMRQ
jgi:hypothetical protein